jgi:hypothetical protein
VIPINVEKEMILDINIKAPFFEDENRAPIDLVAVVDVSGSMRPHLELVKQTLYFVVNQLASRDAFCIITFSNSANVRLNFKKMDSNGKALANEAIQNLNAGGGTHLSGGLLKGVNKARTRTVEDANEVCSILLFTDGRATDGIKEPEPLKEAVNFMGTPQEDEVPPKIIMNSDKQDESKNRQNQARVSKNKQSKKSVPLEVEDDQTLNEVRDVPFTIYTFGYGDSHNAELLREIADFRDGVYYFIQHKDAIADAFTDCLGGLLSVVGQNIDLSLKAMEDVDIANVMASTYRMTTILERREYIIHLGDLQSEEEKDILITVKLPPFRSVGDFELVQWKLNYFNVLTLKQEEYNLVSSVNVVEYVEEENS